MMKSSIYFLTNVIEKCTLLRPSLEPYFRASGPTILQKVVLAIGKIYVS